MTQRTEWRGRRRAALLALASITVAPGLARGQQPSYPSRPVRLIVSYSPGTTGDIIARALSKVLARSLDQPLVVENRGGANGNLGNAAVANAAADGYTLLLAGSASLAINPHLTRVSYDVFQDFAPISMIGSSPLVLLAHPSLPVRTIPDLIAAAKSAPGKINIASGGNGTTTHLAAELLKMSAKIDLMHVPYGAGAKAISDLIAGHVSLMFTAIPTSVQFIQDGRLRAIAVTGTRRSEALPAVPAVAETLPDFEVNAWYGLLAPAGVPKEITARLDEALRSAVKEEEFVKSLTSHGLVVETGTSATFAQYLRKEYERWGEVVRVSGAKVD
ncbi:MAG: Bug family tripartite tricarboxylate transporter substrate binding protein [Burkholderiaceae bacterium]